MKVSRHTIARTIVLVLALVNQILATLGKGSIDIAENDIYQLVSLLFTIGAALRAWWKNNSFTVHAIIADNKMSELKGLAMIENGAVKGNIQREDECANKKAGDK